MDFFMSIQLSQIAVQTNKKTIIIYNDITTV